MLVKFSNIYLVILFLFLANITTCEAYDKKMEREINSLLHPSWWENTKEAIANKWVPAETEAPAELDLRRRAVGLSSCQGYFWLLQKKLSQKTYANLKVVNDTEISTRLIKAIDRADYDQVKLLLMTEKSLTPNFLSELLFYALVLSNEGHNPENIKFPQDIYAIIKLLVEQGANLNLKVDYLSSGASGEFVDQCGHGTQAVTCSIKQFVFSSDYRVMAVKELFKNNLDVLDISGL